MELVRVGEAAILAEPAAQVVGHLADVAEIKPHPLTGKVRARAGPVPQRVIPAGVQRRRAHRRPGRAQGQDRQRRDQRPRAKAFPCHGLPP